MQLVFPGAAAIASRADGGGTTVPAVVREAVFTDLVGFIGDHAELNCLAIPETPPAVNVVAVGDVIDYNGLGFRIAPGLLGLYDPATRTVHLVRPWTMIAIRHQGVLLRDLVHATQDVTGAYPCAESTEWKAHLVQDAFLADHGLDSGFDVNKLAKDPTCKQRPWEPPVRSENTPTPYRWPARLDRDHRSTTQEA